MKKGFSLPMYTSEKVFGWIYVFVHTFFMAYILGFIFGLLLTFGITIPEKYYNLIHYSIGFILIFIFMHHYLKSTFYDLCENKWNTVSAVTTGYLIYYLLTYVTNLIVSSITGETSNPNNDAVIKAFLENRNIMLAVVALMAPIVEEVLFRGVIFGTIRRKNRAMAYIISTLSFAFYHLWQYFIYDYEPSLFLELLQYVPGSIVLAWAYERGKNLWASIALHMIVNFFAISISVSFLG